MATRISIIIPTHNEKQALAALLPTLRREIPGAELIVADGGSTDGTLAIARVADRVIVAPRGRATQMNAGASAAAGEILWFMHADTTPPCDALTHIEQVLASGFCGGCFRIWFDEYAWVFRVSDAIGNLLVDLTGIAYGDHGIFCTGESFHRVGGYPEPIFEDADLFLALGSYRGVRQACVYLFTSSRRYQESGPWRTTIFYILLSALYVLGVRRSVLFKLYDWLFARGIAESGATARNEAPATTSLQRVTESRAASRIFPGSRRSL